MKKELWENRIKNRNDMVLCLTHLTRGKDEEEAFNKLWKILIDQKLIASGKSGFIHGEQKATCFQEVPLNAIVENLMYDEAIQNQDNREKEGPRYSWFGIRCSKEKVFEKGGRPVFYGVFHELENMIPKEQHWRIVALNYLSDSYMIDWTHEREWRCPNDYSFEYNDIEVIVKDSTYFNKFITRCIDENRKDILTKIRGIISLESICK